MRLIPAGSIAVSVLVETVEEFTGLTIDHYVEIGFDGVSQVVDAVGHVNLCIDQDVDDEKSGLKMTEGCHDVGGEQALGIDTRDLDARTMQARKVPGLFFIGECVDVTGWLGGYNFQWAWASADAAGRAA